MYVPIKHGYVIIIYMYIVIDFTPQDSIPLIQDGGLIEFGPNNIQSDVSLTCTVEIEGSYQWVWSGPGVNDPQQSLFDTNRTSYITVAQLSTDSAGEYTCQAMYDPRSLPMGVTSSAVGSRTFTLQFQSECAFELHDELCVNNYTA